MPDSAPATLLDHLRREQANATCLYLQYKGYHWNVSGSLFRELHLMFDEHAKTVLDTADEFAERQRMHGARAPYTLDEMRTLQELPAEDGRPADAGEMLERLREAHLEIIGGLKAAFQTCLKMAPASTPPSTLTSIPTGLYSTLVIVSSTARSLVSPR